MSIPSLLASTVRRRRHSLLLGSADYTGSTLTASVFALTANGSATTTLTGTVYRNGVLASGLPVTLAVSRTSVSASLSVASGTLTIANDGVASATCTIRILDSDGNPCPGIPAASCVMAVSGSGNTLTQPTGVSDENGDISGSFVSTIAAVKTVSWTIAGLAITDTQSVTVSSDIVAFGPGANAPSWSSETVYGPETFDSAIPAIYSSANSNGFQGLAGFDGSYGGNVYDPTRITYPTAVTPIGTRSVQQWNYRGQEESLAVLDAATTAWKTNQDWGVTVSGTWAGTLTFEYSSDSGATWTPYTMTAREGGAVTGSTTTGNGVWSSGTPDNNSTGLYGNLFRVRFSSRTSGTAVVRVGMAGAAAPATMIASTFSGSPTKLYTRFLLYIDPTWSDGGNVGTKLFWWSQTQGNNHYVNLTQPGEAGYFQVSVHLQGGATRVITGSPSSGPANGNWMDVELIFIANTIGASDGTVKMWIDGVSYINETTVKMFGDSATDNLFTRLLCQPTYGGGWNPPPANQYFQLAGWYTEVAP